MFIITKFFLMKFSIFGSEKILHILLGQVFVLVALVFSGKPVCIKELEKDSTSTNSCFKSYSMNDMNTMILYNAK